MGFAEEWFKWMPSNALSNKYELKLFKDLPGEYVCLVLYDSIKMHTVKIIFEGWIDVYQCTDIKYKDRKLAEIENKYGPDFIKHWSFFKVKNSDFKAWGNEESLGLIDLFFSDSNYAQYTFVTTNFIIDVITGCEPKIEVIE